MASCTTSQVTLIGPRRPPRDPTCQVQFIEGAPASPVVDLASAQADCPDTSRLGCMNELRARACQVGADTIYGVSQSLTVGGQVGQMRATLAWQGQPAPAGAAAAVTCTPICSPGFDCQAGKCIPLCNPACDPTEICNRHRTCEPKPL